MRTMKSWRPEEEGRSSLNGTTYATSYTFCSPKNTSRTVCSHFCSFTSSSQPNVDVQQAVLRQKHLDSTQTAARPWQPGRSRRSHSRCSPSRCTAAGKTRFAATLRASAGRSRARHQEMHRPKKRKGQMTVTNRYMLSV